MLFGFVCSVLDKDKELSLLKMELGSLQVSSSQLPALISQVSNLEMQLNAHRDLMSQLDIEKERNTVRVVLILCSIVTLCPMNYLIFLLIYLMLLLIFYSLVFVVLFTCYFKILLSIHSFCKLNIRVYLSAFVDKYNTFPFTMTVHFL